jgi:hypothetical protein
MSSTQVREDRFRSRVPPVGSVLRWRHQGTTHVALHVGRQADVRAGDPSAWRIAGRSDSTSWEHVRSLVGNNPCSIATAWGEVPFLDSVDFGDREVDAYAATLVDPQMGPLR